MKLIGICGVAKAGKDYLCQLLIKEFAEVGLVAKRFALADELKIKINPFLKAELGIDIFNCTAEEKELVRPLLVDFGKVMRIKSEGKFWTGFLEEKIKSSVCDFAIVTDIRYDEYPEDEVFWLQKKMEGHLIHVSRMENGYPILAPNLDEEKNDPRLLEKANLSISWDTDVKGAEKYAKDIVQLTETWKSC